jgi:hypothetical protein
MTNKTTLTPAQEEILRDVIANGKFPSVEAATKFVVDYFSVNLDDLSWAKPYLDVARAQFERGEFVTLEEFQAFMDEKIKELERRAD